MYIGESRYTGQIKLKIKRFGGYVGIHKNNKLIWRNVKMATVGQALTAAESGWARYEDTNSNITYSGSSWIYPSTSSQGKIYSGGSLSQSNQSGASIKFNFTGTKLRLIGDTYPDKSSDIQVYIDGVQVTKIDQYTASSSNEILQRLDYENVDLGDGVHYVNIVNNGTGYMALDAVDIDEKGELRQYNPDIKTNKGLLRVTMIDSSEREYRLSIKEVEGFVNWYKRTLGTGDSCYELVILLITAKNI